MGGDRWCVLCLEVAEEPTRRGGALVAEEPKSKGVWPWASMALGGMALGLH
ncbi:hypothetical protein Syun_017418 [Stephania yunnanensis]|uniref:Uncharacterized protein n=1 Tax=Stephania yunnanensis TaxID=152371 RepID=A0AAP0P5U0_9MAGN